jgi:hypothetical protein
MKSFVLPGSAACVGHPAPAVEPGRQVVSGPCGPRAPGRSRRRFRHRLPVSAGAPAEDSPVSGGGKGLYRRAGDIDRRTPQDVADAVARSASR